MNVSLFEHTICTDISVEVTKKTYQSIIVPSHQEYLSRLSPLDLEHQLNPSHPNIMDRI